MEVAILMVKLSVSELRGSGFLLLPFFCADCTSVACTAVLGFPCPVGEELLTLLDDHIVFTDVPSLTGSDASFP